MRAGNTRRTFVAVVFAISSASCGRIAFDPRGDAPTGGGSDGVAPAGGGENCASPVQISLGVPLTNQSIAGAIHDVPGGFGMCGTSPELVYRITLAATTNATVEITPDFDGGLVFDGRCPPTSLLCQSLASGMTYSNGYELSPGDNYFIISKFAGSGSTFDLRVY